MIMPTGCVFQEFSLAAGIILEGKSLAAGVNSKGKSLDTGAFYKISLHAGREFKIFTE